MLCIQPTMQDKAATLIHILREALLHVEEDSSSHVADISALELRISLLRAIDSLERMRTNSHALQAA